MSMSEKIKRILAKRDITMKELAELLNTTPLNLSNKFKRDNFQINELIAIAEAIDCDFVAGFRLKDTKEIV